jgi:hypothetical protein
LIPTVISHTTKRFRQLFKKLPLEVQTQALRAYRLWRDDPFHSSLYFKTIHRTKPVYSVRIGIHWRAVGVRDKDTMIWYWIGSHADYDALVAAL